MPKIVFWCILLMIFSQVLCQSAAKDADVSKKKKGNGSGCGSHLNSKNGGFHLNITNLNVSSCVFHIKVENTSNLILFFKTLFLQEDDVINVYKENTTEKLLDQPIKASNGSITVVLSELDVTVELKGHDRFFIRDFEGYYSIGGTQSVIPLDPTVKTLYSPTYHGNSSGEVDIIYTSPQVHGSDAFATFLFKQFNFNESTVQFTKSTLDGDYKGGPPVEIFPLEDPLTITVHMKFPTSETYVLKKHQVNSECSKFTEVKDHNAISVQSPPEPLNGSDSNECHWLFLKEKGKLGVQLHRIHFENPLDIIAVVDGGSELAPPLLQVASSNLNSTKDVMIRSTGPYLWIAFRPVDFRSQMQATVSDSGDGGGYFRRNGTIEVDKSATDTSFMLQVDINEIVYLTFNESRLTSGAAIKIFDGFDQTNLLTTLKNGNIWYPVMSLSNKMLVVSTNFAQSVLTANFKGINTGCHHMSTYTNENYVLSKNCNATCDWVISPQDLPGSELLLNLQYISLEAGDSIEIFQLDGSKTLIGSVSGNVTFVPQIIIPSTVGALVRTTRKSCVKDDKVFLVGHSSYLPACDNLISMDALSKFTIVSPQYPDTYPLFANCKWNISTPKDTWVHLAFDAFKLAPNHCIKVNNVILNISDSELPEDILLTSNSILEFNTGNCIKSNVSSELKSAEGFKFNGTVADCGGLLNQKVSGEFEVPRNKTLCIWKVSVPETSGFNDTVNIISYAVNQKDDTGNYELNVYDGSSVRDSASVNHTNSEKWSRTNTLIFIYRRLDLAKPSSILSIKYSTIGCNASNQCDNKVCLHPDWRCNGLNDCGDFSDERNCASVPIPPEIKSSGYSSVAFWLTVVLMFATGIILGVSGPMCYQKYKNGQYRRFSDIQ